MIGKPGKTAPQTMECTLPEPSTTAARRWWRRSRGGAAAGVKGGAAVAALLLMGAGAGAWAQNPNSFPIEPVGTASGAQSVTVTSSAAGGTVSNAEVLTMGATGQDFAAGGGASTCTGATLAPPATCTESVTFTPSAPGLRMGAVVLLDSSGKVVGTGYISGVGKGGLGVLAPGNMVPVAGDGMWTNPGDGKPATQAELNLPAGVAVDGAGNLYIADSLHNRVRLVCSNNPPPYVSTCTGPGIITTIAGNGDPLYSGDGGLATAATLNTPNGVAVDGAGNVYIADSGNSVIRMISAATGDISTVAGNNQGTICAAGSTDAVGDGCPATQATLNAPWGVTVDGEGNFYIADTFDHRIREVSDSTGTIATIAGTGYTTSKGDGGYKGDGGQATAAELNFPYAVAFDLQGNMYIADSANNRIRMVCASATSAPAYVSGCAAGAGTILTVAGTGAAGGIGGCLATSGLANAALLSSPSGVAVDAAGNLYIADTQNEAIRKVNASNGEMTNLVQSGCGVYQNSAGDMARISLYGPIGLAVDPNGDIYVADYYNMIVREIQSNFAALDYLSTPTRQSSQSSPINQTVENDGNDALDLTAINVDANSQLGTGTSCTTGTPFLGVDGDCTIAAVFAPTVAGNPLDATIAITDEAEPSETGANSPLNIELVGNAEAVNSTTTTVTSAPNPSGFGQSVTFTIGVTTGSGTGNLTGTVSLADTFNGTTTPLSSAGGLTLALNAAGTTGTATFSISTLGVGQHSIVASYSGDSGHFASSSTDNGVLPDIQIVQEGTATTLQSSLNPSNVGQSVTFTATVTSAGGGITPDGTVAFMDGANTLATQPLTGTGASATATLTTSTLTNGVHQITAVYSGDAAKEIQPSTSAALSQDVQAAVTIAVTSSPNPSSYGTEVTFTASIPSTATNPPTGTVTFLDNGAKIGTGTLSGNPAMATFQTATLVVGTHPITATYPGDGFNSAASSAAAPYDQTVNQAQTSTTLTAAPNPGIAGMPETITATVKITTGSANPTGTVTFVSGTTTLGTAALNATTGTATITPTLGPGTYNIVATYGGDANDAGSASSPALALAVNPATTTTTVSATPDPALVDAAITFTAKVTGTGGTPTGAVNFLAGATVVGSANLVSGTATFTDTAGLAAGTYAVTADYLGDTNDAASNSNSVSETVGTIPTTTDLGSSTTGGANPQVILVATVLASASGPTPTGTITFNNGTTEIGSATLDSSGVATLVPSLNGGVNYSITAVYSGDADHSPSTSQAVMIAGTAEGFNLTISPTAVTMAASQNATVNVNLSSDGGFTDTIGLGCGSLPEWITCHFSAVSVKLGANGTASAQLTIDTNSPLTGGSSAMNRDAGRRGMSLAGLFLPLSVFFGWIFWRLRRRHASVLWMVLTMALSAAALLATGCSNGFSMGSAAPGTYVIQVVGTGTSSNVVHYQNETVTITK